MVTLFITPVTKSHDPLSSRLTKSKRRQDTPCDADTYTFEAPGQPVVNRSIHWEFPKIRGTLGFL